MSKTVHPTGEAKDVVPHHKHSFASKRQIDGVMGSLRHKGPPGDLVPVSEIENVVGEYVHARRQNVKLKHAVIALVVLFVIGSAAVLGVTYLASRWANKSTKDTAVAGDRTLQALGDDGTAAGDVQTATKVYLQSLHDFDLSKVRTLSALDIVDHTGMNRHLNMVGFSYNASAPHPNVILHLALGYNVEVTAPAGAQDWKTATWVVVSPGGGRNTISTPAIRRRRLAAMSGEEVAEVDGRGRRLQGNSNNALTATAFTQNVPTVAASQGWNGGGQVWWG